MIVHLTETQYNRVAKVLAPYSILAEEFGQEVVISGKTGKMRAVRAPYLFWMKAVDIVGRDTFNSKGMQRTRVARSQRTALSEMAKGCNAYIRHPAWRWDGIRGRSEEILYGWGDLPTGNISAFPAPEWEFLVLVPEVQESGIGPLTFWRPHDSSPWTGDRLAEESVHLRFF